MQTHSKKAVREFAPFQSPK